MISRTITGSKVTQSAWASDVRMLNAKAYHYDNEWIEIPNEIFSFDVTLGVCGDDKFQFGTCFIPTGSITFDGNVNIGKYIRIDLGVEVNGAYEYISYGSFYITEKEVDAYTTRFMFSSATLGAKSGKSLYSALGVSNVSNLLVALADDMDGVSIRSEYAMPSTDELREALTEGTCRDGLEVIAKCYGMAVTESGGVIRFKRMFPNSYNSLSVAEDHLATPFIGKGAFEASTGKIMVAEGYLTEGENEGALDTSPILYTYRKRGSVIDKDVALESYDIIADNRYMSDSTFESYCNLLKTEVAEWEAGVVEMQMGNPLIEPLDYIMLTNDGAVTHSILAFHIVHRYDGGLTTTITAPMLDRSDSTVGYDPSRNPVPIIMPIITDTNNNVQENTNTIVDLGNRVGSKVDSDIVKNDVVVASMEWDEDLNQLRIGGSNAQEVDSRYYETRIGGDGISFRYGTDKEHTEEVASINQDRLEIKRTVVFQSSEIGDWSWEAQSNGNLTLKWKGSDS